MKVDIHGKIEQISYKFFNCLNPIREFNSVSDAFSNARASTFLLNRLDGSQIAVSRWVSPKRTRSYPYTRVYDTLGVPPSVKKVTVIPIVKDEGGDGDRDFLQYDTISLMSLLNVYVILCRYVGAERNTRYPNKITNQQLDIVAINRAIESIVEQDHTAHEWNRKQAAEYYFLATSALDGYTEIGNSLGIRMHSRESGYEKINNMFINPDGMVAESRKLARQAQIREVSVVHPSEDLVGEKASLTITDHLGGKYYFTADEYRIEDNELYLVEGKHSKNKILPQASDIKDALFKMILFSNLSHVSVGEHIFRPRAVVKLTSSESAGQSNLTDKQISMCRQLQKEADVNNFDLILPFN